jgi:FKBP-type peptidyl-prolyl cis-trans isomerase
MKTKLLIGIVGFSGLLFLFGCLKNDDEKLQNEEQAQLNTYIKNKYPSVIPTADGLYYIQTKLGNGVTPTDTDFVLINTSWYLIDETTLVRTNDTVLAKSKSIIPFVSYKGPMKLFLPYIGVRGLEEGITLMKEGGKAKLIVPSKLAYDGNDFFDIPRYSTLIIYVELVRVIKDPIADDKHFINQYLDSLQLKESDISDGIFMKVDKEGTGDSIAPYDTVSFKFTDKALDTIFSIGSLKFLNFKFVIDKDSIFRGLRNAIIKLKKGSEARVILPYNMVAGPGGYIRYPWIVDIPAYTSLYYHLVITDVKKPY